MNRKLFVLGTATVLTVGAAFVGAAIAQDFRGRGPMTMPPQMQGMMQAQNAGSPGSLLDAFDTNKDGALTQDEIDTARAERLKTFDKNGDGKLSLEEYQALWLDAMHRDMVRQFQGHDASGDGQVTADEFAAPFKNAVRRMDTNGDGKLTADDARRPAVQQQGPAQQRQVPQGPGPRRGGPTAAPGTPPGAPAGQGI